jgi:hypothetical protein
MLGLATSRGSSIKHGTDLDRVIPESPTPHSKERGDDCRSYEPSLCPHLPLPDTQPTTKPRKRRMRKKAPKSLDRMTPITEASHDELCTSYYDSEHNPELELISEYEDDNSYHFGRQARPLTPLLFTANANFELAEGDLSSINVHSKENAVSEEEEDPAVHSDSEIDFRKLERRPPDVIRLRGPLQTFEDRLLDATEAKLTALKIQLDMNQITRLQLNTRSNSLRASHAAMKMEFATTRPNVLPEEPSNNKESGSDHGGDLISIRSSIDLEEELNLDAAKVVNFTRITSGTAKVLDILPRHPKPTTQFERKPIPDLSSEVKSPFKPTYYFQHGENPSSFKERIHNVEVSKHRLSLADETDDIQPIGYLTVKSHDPVHRTNNTMLPRGKSRMLAQDCISTHDHTKYRDVDVLTDQQIRPLAAFLKDYDLTTTPPPLPPRKSSKEHYCLRNGHILHPINLKTIPDEAAINSLQVRPYLVTQTGRKTHIHVPVFCDRCGEDVDEELWECDIAVCRIVVCKACAGHMEIEWRERVCAAWEN